MPSNKIYTILVLCLGIIVSVWVLVKKPEDTPVTQKQGSVSVGSTNTQDKTPTDWQSILVTLDANSQKTTSVVPKESEADDGTAFNDTTLTAQMAKDFFARYLSIANQGDVTEADATTIANNVLASPEYTQTTGAVYLISNLHINPKTNTTTTKQYLDSLSQMIEKRGINTNNDDPMSMVAKAVQENNENELTKIDPIIVKAKGIINDLLAMSVPADAVQVHLKLLNTSSNLLSNLEAMRATFTDPVRSFAGASQYTDHLSLFLQAIQNMRNYFEQKL